MLPETMGPQESIGAFGWADLQIDSEFVGEVVDDVAEIATVLCIVNETGGTFGRGARAVI